LKIALTLPEDALKTMTTITEQDSVGSNNGMPNPYDSLVAMTEMDGFRFVVDSLLIFVVPKVKRRGRKKANGKLLIQVRFCLSKLHKETLQI
jgi:hypothetical protein